MKVRAAGGAGLDKAPRRWRAWMKVPLPGLLV